MNNKLLEFDHSARSSLLEGMKVLATAVGSTLGPKGQCVIIDECRDGKPLITKDGVTVAKNIQLKDKFKNLGCQLLKEASTTTLAVGGDGTTTTVVLAYKMIEEVQKLIEKGVNPIDLKNQIEKIGKYVIEAIKNQAIPVSDKDLEKVATISANNDSEIGKFIAEAFQKIGRDGVITVEESSNIKTYIDIINGMQFDRGFESPMFITDDNKSTCVLENPLILLTDRKIQLMKELVPLLEIANKKNRSILIVAQDYDGEVIQNLKINKQRNILQVCAVKAPSYGEYRKSLLEDLAILTGGQVITYESGLDLQKATEDVFGSSDKVVVTRDNTTIIGGHGKKEFIDLRCQQIKNELNNLPNSLDQDFLKEFDAIRIARLSGGICAIRVGGTTEIEMREKKDRIDDAVCATKAAIEEGIVPGGGVSFIIARDSVIRNLGLSPSESEMAILNSLFAIEDKIISNCGLDPEELKVVGEEESLPVNYGFDANNMKWVNMFESGIINPAKVDRCAFENAFSILNMYLTVNTLIVNEEIEF